MDNEQPRNRIGERLAALLNSWAAVTAAAKANAIYEIETMPEARLNKLVRRTTLVFVVMAAFVLLYLFGSTSAPAPSTPTIDTAEQAQKDQQAAADEANRQAQADLEQDDHEAIEQADQQAAVADAPTVLATDYCQTPDFKNNFLQMLNEGAARSGSGSHATDVSLYHIHGEIADRKLVCSMTMNVTIDTGFGKRAETYTGIDVELAPGQGGNFTIRMLSPGTQTMATHVNG